MSLLSMLTKKEKVTDQEGARVKNKQKRAEEKKNKILLQRQRVDDQIFYLLNIYENYAKHYNQNEDLAESIDLQKNIKSYLENIEYGIILTKNAYEKVQQLPYVYEIPKSTQQYLEAAKKEFLLNLENYIKRDEVLKNGMLEILNKGGITDQYTEHANQYLIKAHLHFESLTHYLEKARESVQP